MNIANSCTNQNYVTNHVFLYTATLDFAPLQRQWRSCCSEHLEHHRTRFSCKYKGLLILEKAFHFLVPASSFSVTWNFVCVLLWCWPFLSGIASTLNLLHFIRLTLFVKHECTSEINIPQMIVDREIVAAWSSSEKWYKWYLARTPRTRHPWDQGDNDNTWTITGCCLAFQNCKLCEWGYLVPHIPCSCRNRAIQRH